MPDISDVINKLMDQKDVDDLIRDFSQELLNHANRWIREQEIDIVRSISEFLTLPSGTDHLRGNSPDAGRK